MSTLIRTVLVAAAIFGTVSAASATPYGSNSNNKQFDADKFFEQLSRNGA